MCVNIDLTTKTEFWQSCFKICIVFLLKRVFSLYFFFLPSLTVWKTHKNNTSLSCYHSKQGLSLRVCMFYVLLLPLFCKINDGHKAPKMTQLRQTISFNSHIFHAMTQSCVAWETSLKLSWILTFPFGLLSRNSDVHRSDEILESFGF